MQLGAKEHHVLAQCFHAAQERFLKRYCSFHLRVDFVGSCQERGFPITLAGFQHRAHLFLYCNALCEVLENLPPGVWLLSCWMLLLSPLALFPTVLVSVRQVRQLLPSRVGARRSETDGRQQWILAPHLKTLCHDAIRYMKRQ